MKTPTNQQSNTSSRRGFLKTSAATLTMGALSGTAIPQHVHAAGSDIIKIGMIGSGGRCTGAAINTMQADSGVRLVAMCDFFKDRVDSSRNAIKSKFPDNYAVDDDHVFYGLDGYKHVIESDVDVVLIACASMFHPRYAKAAIDAGKHVFVEKPHGINPADIRLMKETCELAKKKDLCLLSGLMNRYVPGVQETMKRIHDGAIGDIIAIEENYLRAPYVVRGRKPGDSELEYQFWNWYHFTWLSGDDVPQSLVHNLDKSLWALNGKLPLKARGLGGRASSFGEQYGDVFDHNSVIYDFEDGTKIYAYCRTEHNCYNEVSDVILGTKGKCDLLRYRITGENNWAYEGPHGSGFVNEQKDLFNAIRTGRNLVSDYMANSTMITVLGQMAVNSGQQLTWDQVYNSDFTFGPTEVSMDMEPPKRPGPDGNYPIAVPGETKVL